MGCKKIKNKLNALNNPKKRKMPLEVEIQNCEIMIKQLSIGAQKANKTIRDWKKYYAKLLKEKSRIKKQ